MTKEEQTGSKGQNCRRKQHPLSTKGSCFYFNQDCFDWTFFTDNKFGLEKLLCQLVGMAMIDFFYHFQTHPDLILQQNQFPFKVPQ